MSTLAESTTTASTVTDDTTTTAPVTTTVAPARAWKLRGNGFGQAELGASDTITVAAISAEYGQPTKDQENEWTNVGAVPPAGPEPQYTFAEYFDHRWSRSACWGDVDDELCVVLGGDRPESLVFVGWIANGPSWETPSGVRGSETLAESRLSDYRSVSCFQAAAVVDGVSVDLFANGEPFEEFTTNADGTETIIRHHPDPATVTITRLHAGDTGSSDTGDDCG